MSLGHIGLVKQHIIHQTNHIQRRLLPLITRAGKQTRNTHLQQGSQEDHGRTQTVPCFVPDIARLLELSEMSKGAVSSPEQHRLHALVQAAAERGDVTVEILRQDFLEDSQLSAGGQLGFLRGYADETEGVSPDAGVGMVQGGVYCVVVLFLQKKWTKNRKYSTLTTHHINYTLFI